MQWMCFLEMARQCMWNLKRWQGSEVGNAVRPFGHLELGAQAISDKFSWRRISRWFEEVTISGTDLKKNIRTFQQHSFRPHLWCKSIDGTGRMIMQLSALQSSCVAFEGRDVKEATSLCTRGTTECTKIYSYLHSVVIINTLCCVHSEYCADCAGLSIWCVVYMKYVILEVYGPYGPDF